MAVYELLSTTSAERLCGFTATVLLVMRGEESVHGELNFTEGFARIIGIATAFFLRNAEIVSGNEHLHIALQLDNRENTDGDRHDLVFAHRCPEVLGEFFRKCTAHAARNGHTTVGKAVTAIARTAEFCVQANRICNLNFGTRIGIRRNELIIVAVGAVFGRIHAHIAVTAVQNTFL